MSDNTIRIGGAQRQARLLPMEGRDRAGHLYQVDNISLLKDGQRFLPVMGEFHYSRWEPERWAEELLKMKAGGVGVVATYVFWIHHEERRGEWDFTGSRDLRRFLETCADCGVQVWLRIGPWAHGECRNGGFPDWLVQECGERLRTNDPVYLEAVRRFYHEIGLRAAGLYAKDGGPILGIQLENEYGHCGGGPATVEECREHMLQLKRMALAEGMEVPYYTSTGWGGGVVVDGETLPVLGGYVDAPWAGHVQEMPASANFVFGAYKQDENIGSDLKRAESPAFTFDPARNPYFTAELGGGLQPTAHRRTFPYPEDIEAQALCMLGSGANLLGYYMYHGGINPDGKDTTLQESRATGYANDLPVKSYDFQTCIRESGELNASYGRLRRLHLFLQDFGCALAGYQTYFPEKQPSSPEDMETLRVTARADAASGAGFLFVNNHQRKRHMKAHPGACVELAFGADATLRLERLPIGEDYCGVIPFNLRMDTPDGGCALLRRTNASLLCRLGARYFFYTDGEAYYDFAEAAHDVCVTAREQQAGTEKSALPDIITLTSDEAARACRLGDAIYIPTYVDSCLIQEQGRVQLITTHAEERIRVWRAEGPAQELVIKKELPEMPVHFALLDEFSNVQETGSAKNVGGAGNNANNPIYRDYLVTLGAQGLSLTSTGTAKDGEEQVITSDAQEQLFKKQCRALHQLYLDIDYLGDRAEVLIDGRLADDWFTNGETWHLALERFGYPQALTLRIYASDHPLPNPYGNQVYYDLPVEPGCELRDVRARAEYRTAL